MPYGVVGRHPVKKIDEVTALELPSGQVNGYLYLICSDAPSSHSLEGTAVFLHVIRFQNEKQLIYAVKQAPLRPPLPRNPDSGR